MTTATRKSRFTATRKIRIRYGSDRARALSVLRNMKERYWGFPTSTLVLTDRHIEALETAVPPIRIERIGRKTA